MSALGDFAVSTVVYGKFTTYRPSTGAAYTLAGTPALSVYKDNSTTQSTTGVTLTADFDTVTGLNHFAIDTSADGTFYSAGSNFDVVITTGTVDSVSVVGTVVGSFTLRKTSTGLTTADFTATQKASITTAAMSMVRTATAVSVTSSTIVLDASASSVDDYYNGCFVYIRSATAGSGQMRQIVDYTGITQTATIYVAGPPIQGAAWVTNPTGTIVFEIIGFAITPTPVIATAGVVSASISTATVNTIRKNTALANYPFKMVDATDLKTPETGVTVTAERMIDGGTFAACANAVTEDSLGWYHISLATTDLNGDTIVLKFTGTGCATTEHVIITQPT